jgi:hypothetical protein
MCNEALPPFDWQGITDTRTEMTRGDMLRESPMFAMIDLKFQFGRRFVPLRLTDEQRTDIASKVVANMTKHRDVWNLDELLPNFIDRDKL